MPYLHRPEEENSMIKTLGRKPTELQPVQGLPAEGKANTAKTLFPNIQEFRVAVSPREFRETFGIGKTLFFKLVKEGKIRTFKMGCRTLVPMEEVHKLLAKAAG